MILGKAEILIVPSTAGFAAALKGETGAAMGGMKKDAELAGAEAGANLRGGVRGETGKLAGDMEKDGAKAGEGLHKGMSGGMQKVASLIASTGLPLGALSGGLEKSAVAAEHADHKSAGLAGTLSRVGGIAAVGVAGGFALAAAGGIKLAMGMQTADASIAAAAGTSVASAKRIGDAFLGTAGKSEFSGQQMATAFASVAGQLKATEGRALNAKQALQVMSAASDLATAKQIDLGTATSATAGIMQAFQLKTGDAAHVTDVLFQASTATGQGVDTLAKALEKVHSKLGETGGSVGALSALLVDMTNQGITGRAAMGALNSGMNTLQKTANGVTTATQAQKAAFDQMPPALQKLAKGYEAGTTSAKDFKAKTASLPPDQAALAAAFTKSTAAVQSAQDKYKALGVTVFNAQGNFVGMGSIIAQLNPKFAQMTQQQQLATASTIFGAGAARQMTAIIKAGPAAYDKASASVNKNGAAQTAAAKQAKTLHVEIATLGATVTDLATRFGAVLIPIVTKFVGAILNATNFVLAHKAVLIGLAAVVTGVLGTAIAVFTVNKMAAFGKSFVTAKGHVADFASGVKTAVMKVIGMFTAQTAASDAAALSIKTNAAKSSASVATEATEIGTSGAATDASFVGTATAAGASATAVDGSVAAEATAVTAADTTIEAENAAAGASFTSLATAAAAVAAPVAAAAAAAAALVVAGNKVANAVSGGRGETPGANPTTSPLPGPGTGGGVNIFGVHVPLPFGIGGGTGNDAGFSAHTNFAQAHAAAGPTAKGQPLDATQRSYANRIIAIGRSIGASPTAIAAVITEAIAESNLGHDMGWNSSNPTYGGLLAGSTANFAGLGGASSSAVTSAEIIAALKGGRGYVSGGATGLARTSSDLLQIAMTNSGSGTQFLAQPGHGAYAGEARAILASLAGAGGSARVGTTSTPALNIAGWAQSQIGHDAENLGPNRGTELNKLEAQFGMQAQAWCAMFATTAAVMGGAHQAVRTASVALIDQWATEGSHGYEKGIKSAPKVGDLQLFEGGGTSHVGFVSAVNAKAGTVTDIEGNTNQGSGAVRAVTESIKAFGGRFARPIYTGAVPGASTLSPAQMLAQAKAAIKALIDAQEKGLSKSIAAEKAKTAKQIAGEKASLTLTPFQKSLGETITPGRAAQVQATIDQQRAALHLGIVAQRASLSVTTRNEHAQVHALSKHQQRSLDKANVDTKGGLDVMAKLVAAVHAGGIKALQKALEAAHAAGLSKIEKGLEHSHSSALAALGKAVEAAHKQALAALNKDLVAQAKAAAIAKQAAADANETTALGTFQQLITDQANNTATAIADANKVTLDQQAQAGLSGPDLVAAQAQAALDQVTQTADAAIGQAQIGVDQASGGSPLAQALAATTLTQAQAAATVSEAQAGATLSLAQAAAQAASAAASTASAVASTATAAGASGATFNFTINGANMSAADLMSEVGWALKVGALPVAPAPVPVPA